MSFLLIVLHDRPLWECPQGMYPESEALALGVSVPRLVSCITTGQGGEGTVPSSFSMHDTLTHNLAWICERPWGEHRRQHSVLGQDAGVFALHRVWFCAF